MKYVFMILSNIGSIELFFGGQLVFGSVFLFIILKIYHKKTTILLATMIFLLKYIFLGFSFELFLQLLEVIVVLWRYNPKKENLLFLATLYWVFIATPLTFLWGLSQHIQYETSMSYLMTIMQLNGLLNAAIADASTNFTKLFNKLFKVNKEQLPELRVLLFNMIVISLVIPLLLYLSLTSINVSKHVENEIKNRILEKEQSILLEIKGWTLENQILLRLNDQILLRYLDEQFKNDQDNGWYMIYMNDEGSYLTNSNLPFEQTGKLVEVGDHYYQLYQDQSESFFGKYFEWKQSWYLYKTELMGKPLIIMTPLKGYSITAMHTFFEYVPLIILIISPLLLLVYYFTKTYLKSQFRLIEVTKDLPEKINSGQSIDWPQSNTQELHTFTEHFKEVALRLGDMFTKSKELNKQLLLKTSQLEQSREDLRTMAYTDALTSLPNRLRFQNTLDTWINEYKSDSTSIAVIFLDLDKFKLVNDTLGHTIGDQLLQEAAKRIDQIFDHKSSQLVARLGGDEFVVVIKGVTKEVLTKCINKLLAALNQEYLISGHPIYSYGSIGVSLYPQDGLLLDDIVRKADIAMYWSKNKGGNISCFYDEIDESNEVGDQNEK